MILTALLLVIPIALRYLATRRRHQLNAMLTREEASARRLKERYVEIMDDLRCARRQQRHFEVRRTFLANDITTGRRRLQEIQLQNQFAERFAA